MLIDLLSVPLVNTLRARAKTWSLHPSPAAPVCVELAIVLNTSLNQHDGLSERLAGIFSFQKGTVSVAEEFAL